MENNEKKISIAVVKRLPRYYRYLSDLLDDGIIRISSKSLSVKMGITASQIRQDLNCFGGFGQQGYGYNVELLYNAIGKILGVDNGYKGIIIGAGNMGKALVNYPNFSSRGFKIVGIFDTDPDIVGQKIGGLEIMNYNVIKTFIGRNKIDVAIITVPYQYTKQIAKDVVDYGIQGIWNFSPMDLSLSGDVVIENVHLSDSLNVLGYRMNILKNK